MGIGEVVLDSSLIRKKRDNNIGIQQVLVSSKNLPLIDIDALTTLLNGLAHLLEFR